MKNDKMKKIILAEDDKFISMAYQDGLRREGFNVITAFNGIEALEKIRSEKPDIVLLDIIMPDKNGFEVLTEINSDPTINKIPVIIMSNLGQDNDIKKGKELGAKDYMIKANYSISEVVKKIKEYI